MIRDAVPPNELSAHLRSREESLLDPAVRRDRDRVSALLTEDFQEFSASGRVWSREQILELLATEIYVPPTTEDFKCHQIAAGVVLVTYKSVREDRSSALRSSIWIKETGEWRMRFHQGTRVP